MDSFAYETNKPTSLPDWTKLRVVSEDEAARAKVEHDKLARAQWSLRFKTARETIPPKFSWIDPIRPAPKGQAARFGDLWSARLPWLDNERARRLLDLWKERTNLLILGPPDVGKTCLLVLHAQWTLALGEYDAKEVRERRERLDSWTPKSRLDTPPPDPVWLPQVREAKGLRFFSAPDLLDERQQGPNEERLRAAIGASALYLDEVGRELYGAKGGGHLASGRRAVMMRVLEARWANERRFVATSEHTTDELAAMYGNGSFRRIAGERSGATVIDLGEDQWAGVWLRQQGKGQRK